jgi:hypothetical protein
MVVSFDWGFQRVMLRTFVEIDFLTNLALAAQVSFGFQRAKFASLCLRMMKDSVCLGSSGTQMAKNLAWIGRSSSQMVKKLFDS